MWRVMTVEIPLLGTPTALYDAGSAPRCSLATAAQSVAHLRANNTLPKFWRIQNYSTTSHRKQRLEYEANLPSRAPKQRASSAKIKRSLNAKSFFFVRSVWYIKIKQKGLQALMNCIILYVVVDDVAAVHTLLLVLISALVVVVV